MQRKSSKPPEWSNPSLLSEQAGGLKEPKKKERAKKSVKPKVGSKPPRARKTIAIKRAIKR